MQLHRERSRIEDAGANLVIIGNGAPTFIAGFRERSGYEGPIYTDPELVAYRALDLRRGARYAIGLKTMASAVSAYRGGFRQARTQGDAWQLGGVFVVSPAGALVFEYRSSHAGDHPPIDDIVAAVGPIGA